jgi:hypothetical protein
VASPVKPSSKPAASASKAEGQTEQQDAKGVVLKLFNNEGLPVPLQSAVKRTGLEQGPLQVPTARKDKGSDKGRLLLKCTSEFAVSLGRREPKMRLWAQNLKKNTQSLFAVSGTRQLLTGTFFKNASYTLSCCHNISGHV